jgi:hypothetical protein
MGDIPSRAWRCPDQTATDLTKIIPTRDVHDRKIVSGFYVAVAGEMFWERPVV